MQELSDFLHIWASLDGERLICTTKFLRENVEKLLEKEKQQIINAYTKGNRQEYYDGTETSGEQYYNETFNQKSKP